MNMPFAALLRLEKWFSVHPLTRHAKWRAWARFVSWQIRSRVRSEIEVSWIEGQRLVARRGMAGATGNIYAGLHEFTDMMFVLHFLREDDLFIDVGANIGSYTVLASGVRRAKTWAFEPDPAAASALRRNIEINGLDERVVVKEFAVSDHDGSLSFTQGLDTVNHVAAANERDVRRVPACALDTVLSGMRPVMIKLDVEEHEAPAIRGAQALLSGDSLKAIELETVDSEIERLLGERGFRRAYYDPFRRELSASQAGVAASNALFVRDWDFVSARLKSAAPVRVGTKTI
jgi:FkbM family methyltransferase